MNRYERALEAVRRGGHRLTPQRLLILTVIAEGGGHMGVDEVFELAKKSYPYLDIATVYRTIQLFKRLGVVTEVGMGARLHFELTEPSTRHHHMVCKICGGAFDLGLRYLEDLRRTLRDEFDFEPDLDNFTVAGVCAACASKGRSSVGRE